MWNDARLNKNPINRFSIISQFLNNSGIQLSFDKPKSIIKEKRPKFKKSSMPEIKNVLQINNINLNKTQKNRYSIKTIHPDFIPNSMNVREQDQPTIKIK